MVCYAHLLSNFFKVGLALQLTLILCFKRTRMASISAIHGFLELWMAQDKKSRSQGMDTGMHTLKSREATKDLIRYTT